MVNPRMKTSQKEEWDGRDHSITINIAPLSVSVFRHIPQSETSPRGKKDKKDTIAAENTKNAKSIKDAKDEKNKKDTKITKNIRSGGKEISGKAAEIVRAAKGKLDAAKGRRAARKTDPGAEK